MAHVLNDGLDRYILLVLLGVAEKHCHWLWRVIDDHGRMGKRRAAGEGDGDEV
jgi:hypothetical protein